MPSELRNPVVLGVKVDSENPSMGVSDMLMQTGGNTGNLLFAKSTFELFDNSHSYRVREITPDLAQDHDCIVIAAANWLNEGADFGELTSRLEAANLPIIVLGLGAQANLNKRIPKLKPGMQRFVSLLAERSPLISARGAFSCEVLAHYGAKNAIATGCPSFLMSRSKVPAFRASDMDEPLRGQDITIHSTRHRFNAGDPFHTYLYRQAYINRHDLLLQSELADFYFALERSGSKATMEKVNTCLQQVYQATPTEIQTYLNTHGQIYFDVDEWLDYCRSKRFFIGTRIHGTIASILAGTPALLIAHDSRTVELAETMGIPFVLKGEIDIDQPLQTESYYRRTLEHDFEISYHLYWNRFKEFFEGCGLRTNLCAEDSHNL